MIGRKFKVEAMFAFYILLAVSSLAFITSDDASVTISAEEAKAIEAGFDRLASIERVLKSLFGIQDEEARDEKCLPWNSPCSFYKGPNCCGIRMRCFVFKGRCREYNAGVLLDNIINATKSIG